MVKLIGTAYKRDDFTTEEFFRYWREVHAPITGGSTRDPRLRRLGGAAQVPGGELEADAFVELWWDDEEALDRAMASPGGAGRLGGRRQLREAERHVLGGEGARLHSAADHRPGLSHQ